MERAETEYRPTKLTTEKKEGGLEGAPVSWTLLPTVEKEGIGGCGRCVRRFRAFSRMRIDGSMWLGYTVRLRVLARKT